MFFCDYGLDFGGTCIYIRRDHPFQYFFVLFYFFVCGCIVGVSLCVCGTCFGFGCGLFFGSLNGLSSLCLIYLFCILCVHCACEILVFHNEPRVPLAVLSVFVFVCLPFSFFVFFFSTFNLLILLLHFVSYLHFYTPVLLFLPIFLLFSLARVRHSGFFPVVVGIHYSFFSCSHLFGPFTSIFNFIFSPWQTLHNYDCAFVFCACKVFRTCLILICGILASSHPYHTFFSLCAGAWGRGLEPPGWLASLGMNGGSCGAEGRGMWI